jgi:hypothetical protein
MTIIFDQSISCAKEIEKRFRTTGDLLESTTDERLGLTDLVFSSMRYRRAHISIVDARATKKIWMLHVTVFPHFNDPSPIFGFDAVCGPNKITGAFCDFSVAGDPSHPMMRWFNTEVQYYEWKKERDLPDWAKSIFSPSMLAASNVQIGVELDNLCELAVRSLDYYLKNVGNTQQDASDYHMAQNRYCHYQKQNPQVVRSMVAMGIEEVKIKRFVNEVLFPEIG